jgi:hypothetical protein
MFVNPSKAKLGGLGARRNSTNSQTSTGKISGYLNEDARRILSLR